MWSARMRSAIRSTTVLGHRCGRCRRRPPSLTGWVLGSTNRHQSGNSGNGGNGFKDRESGSFVRRYLETWRRNPLPIWVGLSLVALIQFRRIRSRDRKGVAELSDDEAALVSSLEANPAPAWQVALYSRLPLEAASRAFGFVCGDLTLPTWARKPLIGLYAGAFGCDLSEAEVEDPSSYRNLGEFFRRRLKPGARPIDAAADLVSPCDGRVLTLGPVDPASGRLEQVKGMTYSMQDFLGVADPGSDEPDPESAAEKSLPPEPTKLVQITMYLAPGDYHCFHSPADWDVERRHHFPGKLLSVRPSVLGRIPDLLVANERAVYLGRWKHGFFSLTAVGATNVGSIVVPIDGDLRTNRRGKGQPNLRATNEGFEVARFDRPVRAEKGDFYGEFNLGSTIVLVFRVPEDFMFQVVAGQKVRVGQPL